MSGVIQSDLCSIIYHCRGLWLVESRETFFLLSFPVRPLGFDCVIHHLPLFSSVQISQPCVSHSSSAEAGFWNSRDHLQL